MSRAAGPGQSRHLLAIEGKPTRDGRQFACGALTWERLPVYVTDIPEGFGLPKVVATVVAVERIGDRVWGTVEPALPLTTVLAVNVELVESSVAWDEEANAPDFADEVFLRAGITGATITTRERWAWAED